MRLRHIPGAEQMIEETPHVVHGAKEKKGTWQQIFGNDHPIRIEVGMGKGQFILEQASLEIGADAMFKATMVDGVYDKDPHKYPDAVKYDTLTFTRVLDERLAVMDSTAATLCRDNGLPIVVFDLNEPANIARALQGENVGTIVRE